MSKETSFDKLVYNACKSVPKGRVATYSSIADQIGHPRAYRAVGTSLRKNPYAPHVPCHRVIAANRTLGGFYGSKNDNVLKRKYDMLIEEGVLFVCVSASDDKQTSLSKVKVSEECLHSF